MKLTEVARWLTSEVGNAPPGQQPTADSSFLLAERLP
jgi:hypothetical protein